MAAYPILPSRTYRAFSQRISGSGGGGSGGGAYGEGDGRGGALLPGDRRDSSWAAWKLLHYVSFLSILFMFPYVVVSRELPSIGRNCNILGVAFF